MTARDPERMKNLLARSRMTTRAAALAEHWALRGIHVSCVEHRKYCRLVDRLRGGQSWSLRWTDDLSGELRAFTAAVDLVEIFGWRVEEEPALLIAVDALIANVVALHQIYPDGFVLIDRRAHALLVDFDEDEGTHVNVVELGTGEV